MFRLAQAFFLLCPAQLSARLPRPLVCEASRRGLSQSASATPTPLSSASTSTPPATPRMAEGGAHGRGNPLVGGHSRIFSSGGASDGRGRRPWLEPAHRRALLHAFPPTPQGSFARGTAGAPAEDGRECQGQICPFTPLIATQSGLLNISDFFYRRFFSTAAYKKILIRL